MSKSNSNEFDIVKNFEPMPKRFMVWDSWHDEWLHPYSDLDNDEPHVFDLYEMLCRLDLVKLSVKEGVYKICQSTNLFDKEGKEIFEGSIVDFTYWQMAFAPDQERRRTIRGVIGCDSLGHYIQRIGGSVKLYLSNYANGYENKTEFYKDFTILGHAFLNPELLEEK